MMKVHTIREALLNKRLFFHNRLPISASAGAHDADARLGSGTQHTVRARYNARIQGTACRPRATHTARTSGALVLALAALFIGFALVASPAALRAEGTSSTDTSLTPASERREVQISQDELIAEAIAQLNGTTLDQTKLDKAIRSIIQNFGQKTADYNWTSSPLLAQKLGTGIRVSMAVKMQRVAQPGLPAATMIHRFDGWGRNKKAAIKDLYASIREEGYQLLGLSSSQSLDIKQVNGARALARVAASARVGSIFELPNSARAIVLTRLERKAKTTDATAADAAASNNSATLATGEANAVETGKRPAAHAPADAASAQDSQLVMLAPLKGTLKVGMPLKRAPFPLNISVLSDYRWGKEGTVDLALRLSYPIRYGIAVAAQGQYALGLKSKANRGAILLGADIGVVNIGSFYMRPSFLVGHRFDKEGGATGFRIETGVYHDIAAGIELGIIGAYEFWKARPTLDKGFALGLALRY